MTQTRPGEKSSIDLSRYIEDKAAGNAKIVKVRGRIFLDKKRYSPDTGEEIDQDQPLYPLTREGMVKSKTELQALMDNIDAVIADMDAS